MNNLEELDYLIENELENTRLDFKRKFYHKEKYNELIKDVMAMANAHVEDTKYIIFGVKLLEDGSRSFHSVQQLPDQADIEQLIHNNIEPTIELSFYPHKFKNHQLAILEVQGFNDRPYISKKDYRGIKAGDSVIRKGSTTSPLNRNDLDKIYSHSNKNVNPHKIEVGLNENLETILEVSAKGYNTKDLPSSKEKKFYEEKLTILKEHIQEKDRKNKATPLSNVNIEGVVNFGRMFSENGVHDKKIYIGTDNFGMPIRLSEEELKGRIANVTKTYFEDDAYFLQENVAQNLNPYILNNSDKFLEDVYIELYISTEVGYIFTEHYDKPVNGLVPALSNHLSYMYPNVEKDNDKYVITESIGTVRHQIKDTLLINPLKIIYSSEIIGKSIMLDYELHAKNLSNPFKGSLEIKIHG